MDLFRDARTLKATFWGTCGGGPNLGTARRMVRAAAAADTPTPENGPDTQPAWGVPKIYQGAAMVPTMLGWREQQQTIVDIPYPPGHRLRRRPARGRPRLLSTPTLVPTQCRGPRKSMGTPSMGIVGIVGLRGAETRLWRAEWLSEGGRCRGRRRRRNRSLRCTGPDSGGDRCPGGKQPRRRRRLVHPLPLRRQCAMMTRTDREEHTTDTQTKTCRRNATYDHRVSGAQLCRSAQEPDYMWDLHAPHLRMIGTLRATCDDTAAVRWSCVTVLMPPFPLGLRHLRMSVQRHSPTSYRLQVTGQCFLRHCLGEHLRSIIRRLT